MLDTTDPVALEAALRVYPGRALINSVNGDPESIASVLPLARRYGAAVVVLALDDAGIPADSAGRLAVVERVRAAAHAAGMDDTDLVVDALVMTAATDADAPRITVASLAAAHDSGTRHHPRRFEREPRTAEPRAAERGVLRCRCRGRASTRHSSIPTTTW